MSLATSLASVRARWSSLPGREKNLIRLATLLILGLLLWQLSVGPSLRTLRTAGAQSQALTAQLQQMQSLQTQAQALQKQPALGADESVRALTAADRLAAKPWVLQTVAYPKGGFAELAKTAPLANPEQQLRLINGYYGGGEPKVGQTVKAVVVR